MIVKCISNELTLEQKESVPQEFKAADFHITIDREYVVFGITIISVKDQSRVLYNIFLIMDIWLVLQYACLK